MFKIALLTADTRLAFQIETWLRDLASEVKLEKFSSVDGFSQHFNKSAEALEEEAEDGAETPSDGDKDAATVPLKDPAPADSAHAGLQYLSKEAKPVMVESAPHTAAAAPGLQAAAGPKHPLRVVIVDIEIVKSRPLQWMTDMQKSLVTNGHATADIPPRFLVMMFEGGAYTAQNLTHPVVTDLVVKPLDRSLFLQKLEILLAETPKIKPAFLFRQKTDVVIEAGKDAIVDEISDFAVAIRNPAPIYEGVYASLHAKIFGEGADNRVVGRVYSSVRHPTYEGDYLVRFSFFGISPQQILNVKKYLRTLQAPVARTKSAPAAKASGFTKSKIADIPRPENQRRIAVIDMNRDNVTDLKTALESNFKDTTVRVFPSYTRFLGEVAKFFPTAAPGGTQATPGHPTSSSPANGPEGAPPAKAHEKKPAFPRGEKLTFILKGGGHEFGHFEPLPKSGEKILGREIQEYVERPDLLLSAIEKEDREDFDEFLTYVESGGNGGCLIRLQDAHHRIVFAEAKGVLAKVGDADGVALLRIEFMELPEEKWRELTSSVVGDRDPEHLRFDAIFIDGGMLRTEPAAWTEGLRETLRRANIWHEGLPEPRILVMAAEKSRLNPENFRCKGFTDFFYKQADRKYLVQKIQALLPRLERREDSSSPFLPCETHIKLAKDVRMVEVSEYGITLVHPSPFREGVFMRFFSHLFGDNPEGVIGRCAYCEKVEGEGAAGHPRFLCHFSLFGANDELLKKIRSWIREDYVHKKEGTGG
jgi:hypothetical protein